MKLATAAALAVRGERVAQPSPSESSRQALRAALAVHCGDLPKLVGMVQACTDQIVMHCGIVRSRALSCGTREKG